MHLLTFSYIDFFQISITVVEIEPIVINLAKKWFDVEDDQKRKTITMDGIDAIEAAEKKGNFNFKNFNI